MKQFLKDIADISAGQGAPQGDSNYCENGFPFVKAGNLLELTEGSSIYSIQKVSEEVAKKHGLKLYKKGTILFAKSGMSCLKGYVYVLPCDAYVVSHLACVTPNEDISEYLKYYFCYHKPNQLVKDAAYPSISLSDIGCLEIDLKDATHRNVVVDSLQKLSSIVKMRKQQLTELDTLVKARFVEMFGDPEQNPHKYMVVSLHALIERGMITYHLDGNHGGDYPRSEEFTITGVPYIGANCIVDGRIDFGIAKHLPPERANRLRKGIAQHGDVLFAHNATVGPVVVLETHEPKVILSTSLTAYRCNTESINPYYLSAYMRSDGFVRQYSAEMKQTTRNQVPITAQKKYLFMIPPIEQQKQFATFVEQVDKSKVVVQKALDEAQVLFNSLMQEYFG